MLFRSVLASQGAAVTREYYFNDHGAQIDRFARSLMAAANGEPTPEDGYAGEYINDIAAQVLQKSPDVLSLPPTEEQETFRRIGVDLMFTHIKESLHEFGTDFDVFTHEDSMHTSGRVEEAIARLRAKVIVTPDQVEIRNGIGSTVVPRRPVPEVVVTKQTLGWTPVLRVTGGTDVPVLPLAGWSRTSTAKAAAELTAALDRVRRR